MVRAGLWLVVLAMACKGDSDPGDTEPDTQIEDPDTDTADPDTETDTAPPETSLTEAPTGVVADTDANFVFTGTDDVSAVTFMCALDGASPELCTSPSEATDLLDGEHVFVVYAVDASGNDDATPAEAQWTVDTEAPQTTIDGGPSFVTNSTEASFTLSSPAADLAGFECRLDDAEFANCTSPAFVDLAEGDHQFEARALDTLGNVAETPAVFAWTIDLTPPETAITGSPPEVTNQTTATFTVDGLDAVSQECSLDGAIASLCPDPMVFDDLQAGPHTMAIAAVDAAGNIDPTAAMHTWRIDLTPPDTRLDGVPEPVTRDASVVLAYSSLADDVTAFECSVDGAGYAPCSASQPVSAATLGPHEVRVRSIDAAGNVDPTPIAAFWSRVEGRWVSSANGRDHGCGIADDASLWCWGAGILGDGQQATTSVVPVREGLARTDWASVSAGDGSSCAITVGGALYCWGNGRQGANGGGTTDDALLPTQVGTTSDWVQVSSGGRYSCAVNQGGELYCWGSDRFRQLGGGPSNSGDISTPQAVEGSGWTSVYASFGTTCALKNDDTLFCWGNNASGQVGVASPETVETPSPLAGTWKAVATMSTTTSAIRTDGTLWSWGANHSGALGIGSEHSSAPTPSPQREAQGFTDWVQVASASASMCGLRENGELWCWGTGGLVGDGTGTYQTSPTRIGADADWAQLAPTLGGFVRSAVRNDGTLWSWGFATGGGLGNGRGRVFEPIQESLYFGDWETVEAGGSLTCGIRNDERWCWGNDRSSQLGEGRSTSFKQPGPLTQTIGDLEAISIGWRHSCTVLDVDGSLWCSGFGFFGALGHGTTASSFAWVRESSAASWLSVFAGYDVTHGIQTDGSLWGWGFAPAGQVGTATGTFLAPNRLGNEADWVTAVSGRNAACGLRDSGTGGTAYCWGRDTLGQRGVGTESLSVDGPQDPVVGSIDFVALDAGYEHFCGIDALGGVWCWGDNQLGQTGAGEGAETSAPVAIDGLDAVVQLALTRDGGCALTELGEVACWGDDRTGGVGDGETGETAFTPVTLPGTNWTELSAGIDHVCGLREEIGETTLWCWGSDLDGQIGVAGGPALAPRLSLDPL